MICSKFLKINIFLFSSPSLSLALLTILLQAYPNRDITNIVESSHYQKIGGWCRQGALNANKCKGAHRWIKPFRCLGKFKCLFSTVRYGSYMLYITYKVCVYG